MLYLARPSFVQGIKGKLLNKPTQANSIFFKTRKKPHLCNQEKWFKKMRELEQKLLKELVSGDRHAFDVLFRTYYSQLFFIARDILLDSNVAEEIVQDVFVKIWESSATLSVSHSLKAYLAGMTRNRCIDYLRNQKTTKHITTISLDDINVRSQLLNLESDTFIREELFTDPVENALRKAIDELAPQCRQIFTLNRFEGYSCQQIAEMLNLSVSTVKTQVARALQKLKEEVIDKR
jgi:RNA polymerase sigma-70 factor (ECF subfamily)